MSCGEPHQKHPAEVERSTPPRSGEASSAESVVCYILGLLLKAARHDAKILKRLVVEELPPIPGSYFLRPVWVVRFTKPLFEQSEIPVLEMVTSVTEASTERGVRYSGPVGPRN